MKTVILIGLALAGSVKSDYTGVYAVVDKVVLEPSDSAPERIQIWGTFALAKEKKGEAYFPPARGYLYLSLNAAKREVCLKEWNDLKSLAGSGQGVAFGTRLEIGATVRKASDKPEKSDAYPIGWGLHKVEDSWQVANIKLLPVLSSPAENEAVSPGPVTLTARTSLDTGTRKLTFHFEIEGGGRKESETVESEGNKTVQWIPPLPVAAGVKYTWRVWASEKETTHTATMGTFTGKK